VTAPHVMDCRDDTRRAAVRAAPLNGIDYVEVSEDQLTLTVYFLGKAPSEIGVKNVRVDGGTRVRDIQVREVRVYRETRRGRDDRMEVVVDRPGDFTTYTLRLVTSEHEDRPMEGFDVRYATLDFSFKAGCASELDCADKRPCAPAIAPPPDINYLARDYTGFRQLLLDRLAVILPEWRERHAPDIGVALVELLAYTGDYLSQYQDAVATEAYLDTARLRISVRRHARLVDYQLFEGRNARAWLTIDTRADLTLDLDKVSFVTRYVGAPEDRTWLTWVDLARVPDAAYVVFEPLWPARPNVVKVRAAHSRIDFYTWGECECCLPSGATEATLVDAWLPASPPPPSPDDERPVAREARLAHDPVRGRRLDALAVGDVLILEEVIGPRTGNPADADPAHRHAVRLTEVRRDVDPLYPVRETEPRGTPIVHVRWCRDDALPFCLCVCTHRPAPDCGSLAGVSVARGNVLLVDHGRSWTEPLPQVPGAEPVPICDPCDEVGPLPAPPRFEPVLEEAPLTFAAPLDTSACALGLGMPPTRASLPQASLIEVVEASDGTVEPAPGARWTARADLLDVVPTDRSFVAEVDDDGYAHLRFAADPAARPAPGTRLEAHYRVGVGPEGNVGPEAIAFAVSDVFTGGESFVVRNPLPAAGGMAPETLSEARMLAPDAFRLERERAVIADDYAELLARELRADVQGAAATLRWTGSWYEAQVGVDVRGAAAATGAVLRHARAALHRYRRIGHDLRVASARLVPLAVALDVCVAPHEARAGVRAELLGRLGGGRMRDGRLGLFHPDNLRYGEGVTVSELVAAAAQLRGVASVAVTRLERLGEGPNGELEAGILPIGAMEIAQLDNDPSFPERGTLTITMQGGR
jgi:hypothetical protein